MIRTFLLITITVVALSMFVWEITKTSNSKISDNIKAAICAKLPNC